MRYINCGKCNEDKPINDTLKVDGKIYCSQCLNTTFPQEEMLDKKVIEKGNDPTVCSFCQKDNDSQELKKISIYPICSDCEIDVKNRTFPTWVKGFFAAVLLIVIFSFFWNWKYYKAYNNIQDSFAYSSKGDYFNAKLQMDKAASIVPESEDLRILSAYYNGVDLLMKDKSTQALVEFRKCEGILPSDYDVATLRLTAEIGSTFDNKDYKGFLEASKENLAIDSTSAESYTSVASAYACIYATEKKEDAMLNAISFLNKAKAIDSTSAEMKEYYNRVEYRLSSGKIITSKEFIKQFPKGWVNN